MQTLPVRHVMSQVWSLLHPLLSLAAPQYNIMWHTFTYKTMQIPENSVATNFLCFIVPFAAPSPRQHPWQSFPSLWSLGPACHYQHRWRVLGGFVTVGASVWRMEHSLRTVAAAEGWFLSSNLMNRPLSFTSDQQSYPSSFTQRLESQAYIRV